ncbi:TPA: efflux RND transporter periplasmic adaptor subunit [Klebsiella aerogenes]|uniref:Transmembrane protein affecting septum formation and cell membrane permeability n=1 Tax=Klebsiella aerogenes (strain ATCC 13048 / DSM 30053 / CCUG 1429 / JCM 1235 / KCTC 2190 / NBRC 13534 / NCIMB 10102 / NCTC 10006 / CDC 819-56) TaxID=1028307 RepID=A0A0H3FKF5_KLEAK|nr:efflux RND transporter periplasmic adaptor subunit [Klebsiella aerogenes]AEG95874.1 transmembrane protein affecting septum formation and cell membrane permeability [Klebsiella aerogenes KCTC 2190]EIV5807576.1 efflux RND transporter periplasmic adaptor subunit [Klebsiella aerogenes]EIV6183022.1 efflux RND transporter periplasmic adaptor subunit [Klebsiella aerogenes]EIV6707618.1 efflux RND transporter periplasmic adaptor subunit [Klebsiella aerogenes]EIV9527940.1 efflux RND transporter perip
MTSHARVSLLSSLIISALLLTGCDNSGDQQAQPQAPQVSVHVVHSEPLSVTTELPGRTSAFRVAEVRPQVSGIILKRNFVEGSDIKAGESLYQIDPATYQAAWNSAKGDEAKAEAAAAIAHLTVKRYVPLLGTQYISQQEYDQAVATARQADADVVAAKAAVENARINLAYTKVTSPIDGRIGKSSVTEGALVTNGQADAMATVQQLDPIYVDVTESSNDFMRLKQESLQRGDDSKSVQLIMENGQPYSLKGSLQFSDVTVDESTGSITLRAVFPNPQHTLLPGMFVRARIDEGVNPQAILVPQQGVTRTPRGDATVLIVNAQNQVENREVTAAQAIGNKWLITSGLQNGDKVIVSGLQKVRPGVTVKATEDTTASAAQ